MKKIVTSFLLVCCLAFNVFAAGSLASLDTPVQIASELPPIYFPV